MSARLHPVYKIITSATHTVCKRKVFDITTLLTAGKLPESKHEILLGITIIASLAMVGVVMISE